MHTLRDFLTAANGEGRIHHVENNQIVTMSRASRPKLLASAAALFAMVGAADAATIVDRKLAQFGIEPRLTCGKWVKRWQGDKICVGGGRTEFLQHNFHLVVDGPGHEAAGRKVLEEAGAAAVTAALATASQHRPSTRRPT
jgi:hypothetical protein